MKIRNVEESRVINWLVAVNDMVVVLFSYWLSFGFYNGFGTACGFPEVLLTEMKISLLAMLVVSMVAPPVFLNRMIRSDRILARAVYTASLQGVLMAALMNFIYRMDMSRKELLLAVAVFAVLLFLERMCLHSWLKRKRKEGRNLRYVVLVGHSKHLAHVCRTLSDCSFGFRVKGVFSSHEVPPALDVPLLGNRARVIPYLKEHPEVTDLYIVPDMENVSDAEEIYRYCESHAIRFYAIPIFVDFLKKHLLLTHLGGTMLLSVRNEPLEEPMTRMVKRAFDIVVSAVFLLTFFPIIYVVVAICIKMQSPGPVFFVQKRNGLDGREFGCIKFRSMHVNADADRLQATKDDPRKFRFGNLLRRTNVDELPQLINVLKGDMSLVGPRPHMLLHTQEYSALIGRYMVRHLVKPGITGWAQCQGLRGETKTLEQMEARVRSDIWYVENWSFALDLRIIWRTAVNMLLRKEKNAY